MFHLVFCWQKFPLCFRDRFACLTGYLIGPGFLFPILIEKGIVVMYFAIFCFFFILYSGTWGIIVVYLYFVYYHILVPGPCVLYHSGFLLVFNILYSATRVLCRDQRVRYPTRT